MVRLERTCSSNISQAEQVISQIVAEVTPWLAERPEELFYLRLILTELVMNAVQYGSSGDCRPCILVRVGLIPSQGFVVLVGDRCGRGFDPVDIAELQLRLMQSEQPDLRERGRGLALVVSLCDRVVFRHSNRVISAKRSFGT